MDQRPDLVLIMTDHQRADSIGGRIGGVELCPTLNRLAAGGTRCARAYTSSPICVPARTSLATGRYPMATGVVCNDWQGLRAQDHRPLHQDLAAAGYAVAHIGVDHIKLRPTLRERVDFACWRSSGDHVRWLGQRGLEPGIQQPERFKRAISERHGAVHEPVRYSNSVVASSHLAAEDFLDPWLCREATTFVERDESRPLALFLYLWAPHPPLVLPPPYDRLIDPEQVELPPNVDRPAAGEPANRRAGIAAQLAAAVSAADWRRAWAAHGALVRMVDDQLPPLLQALQRRGRKQLLCFTSDHGEQLGQHRMYQKMEMYEEALRVPLLWSGDGVVAQRIDAPLSHLDIVPTFLAAAGIAPGRELHGQDLLPLLRGERTADPERIVFSQYSGNPVIGDLRRAAVDRRFKYVFDPDSEPELYDLATDPAEMQNRAGDPALAAEQRRLHAACAAWHRQHGDWVQY